MTEKGEYTLLSNDQMAYTLGHCGSDVIVGITEEKEVLIDLRTGTDSVISLGIYSEAPMPPDDDGESHDSFDWGTWSEEVRKHIIDQ